MYACIVHSLLSISKTQSKLYVRQRIWPRSPSNIVYDISINTFLSARFYEKRKRKKKERKKFSDPIKRARVLYAFPTHAYGPNVFNDTFVVLKFLHRKCCPNFRILFYRLIS